MTLEERVETFVTRYGEVCKMSEAAQILSCNPRTVKHMLEDGRLDYACQGERVDVRSIARYVQQPKQEDFEARKRKLRVKYNSEYAV